MLTDDQIRKLVEQYMTQTLREDEEGRAEGQNVPTEEEVYEEAHTGKPSNPYLVGLDVWKLELRESLNFGRSKTVEHIADTLLEESNIPVEKGTTQYKVFCRELIKAGIKTVEIIKERNEGNYSNPYDATIQHGGAVATSGTYSPVQPQQDKGMLLSDLFEEYIRERKSKERWEEGQEQKEYRPLYETFQWFIKDRYRREDVGIKELTKDDFLSYCEMLKEWPARRNVKGRYKGLSTIAAVLHVAKETKDAPLSLATRNKYIERVGFVFHYAKENGYMPVNYASGLSSADPRSGRDKGAAPLSIEELNRLFSSPLYKDTPKAWSTPENFFIPLIALYSGMRIEEICRLRLEDVKQSPEGIWYFDITHNPEEKETKGRAKSKSSRRSVPIHPKLRALGFFEYLESVKKAGKRETVFDVVKGAKGKFSERFQKFYQRFNKKYMQKSEADKHRITFHALRATLQDELYRVDIRTETIKDIVGHAQDGVTFGTYIPAQLKKAFEALQKVEYPGLDLSHLKAPLP